MGKLLNNEHKISEEPLSHISKTYVNSKMYIKKVIYIIITI